MALPRLAFLDRDSVANVQGLASIPTVRLERRLGRVPAATMSEVKAALVFALDLEQPNCTGEFARSGLVAQRYRQLIWFGNSISQRANL